MKLKNRIFNLKWGEDRTILAICIGIAVIFWFLVELTHTYTTVNPVSIAVLNIPENKALLESPPRDMEVKLEGEGWDLLYASFSRRKIKLNYDLAIQDILQRNYAQLKADIESKLRGRNLSVVDMNYDRLRFDLEDKKSKKIPLLLNESVVYAPDFHPLESEMTLSPDSITITGPVSVVDAIDLWETDSLLADNQKIDVVSRLNLKTPSPEIILSDLFVDVNIPVEQYTQKSLFIPIKVINPPDSFRIFPQKIKLSCKIGLSHYDNISEADFTVVVDVENIPILEGKKSVPITISKIPGFARNVTFSPKSAELLILE